MFGCTCYVLNDRDHLGKFRPKADEAKFIGYSLTSKAYRAFLINSRTIVESINVSFDDSFQATSEQLNSRLKLNDIHPTRALINSRTIIESINVPLRILSEPLKLKPLKDQQKMQALQMNIIHVQNKL